MGTEAKRLVSIKKPESWVSNHRKGILGQELVPGSSRRTEKGADLLGFYTLLWLLKSRLRWKEHILCVFPTNLCLTEQILSVYFLK